MSSDVSSAGCPGGKLTDHVSIRVLTRVFPRFVVDEVLAETGRVEKHTRSLPAHVVVYFVPARGCNPARVTVTSRRTAALDGRLLAAVRAWRQ
ncbi:MAG: transposase domain-containing protein [Rubrobacter sp.]|nr:transposase domain-containing protein [Rubrobacter sp.]